MANEYFLDIGASDYQTKMTEMYRHLDGEDPLLSALIGAAHIDKCLVALLESFFRSSKTTKDKHLSNDASGVLLSLYTRAEFAYMLGLIKSATLTNIQTICKIRNKFAHSHELLDFDREPIFSLCKSLKVPGSSKDAPYPVLGQEQEYDISDYENYRNLPRNRFTDTVSLTVIELARLPKTLERLKTPYIDGEPPE